MTENARSALILVVDDRPGSVQSLAQILVGAGYEAQIALGGPQALAKARERKPDLVLLDMMMPLMDGFEVCTRLREIPGLADTPVIFVTGAMERDAVIRAFAAGAVDYVTKPFIPEELLARVRTHVDLKRARDHLAAMVREREDTTHVVAHDLKNPLTCILFSVTSLARGVGPARHDELVADIRACSNEALELIGRFLARGAEGQRLRQFKGTPTDLAQLVREAFQFRRAEADERGVRLRLQGDAPANADPKATRNVLQNLVANAIQYSPPGEEVLVTLSQGRPGFSQCLVMDRGPGVAPADQEKLFQRFARLATADRGRYSSGLGLAIAKHDVAQMDGYLWYEARAGGGSTFGFELPRPSPDTGDPREAPQEDPTGE